MLIDSPYFPDELELLPTLLGQAGFEPSGLLATHADCDHLLGRLAFPGSRSAWASRPRIRLRAEPGAAQRELREADAEHYVDATRAAVARLVADAAGARLRRARRRGDRAAPRRRPHAPTAPPSSPAGPACSCVGDYLSRRRDPDAVAGRLARRVPRDARPPRAAGRGGEVVVPGPRLASSTATPRCGSSTRTSTTSTASRKLPAGRDTKRQREIHAENLQLVGSSHAATSSAESAIPANSTKPSAAEVAIASTAPPTIAPIM